MNKWAARKPPSVDSWLKLPVQAKICCDSEALGHSAVLPLEAQRLVVGLWQTLTAGCLWVAEITHRAERLFMLQHHQSVRPSNRWPSFWPESFEAADLSDTALHAADMHYSRAYVNCIFSEILLHGVFTVIASALEKWWRSDLKMQLKRHSADSTVATCFRESLKKY